ncbi:bifunctional protein-serine/threonine kinase/phosphatase [Simiduia sp. 21SJ11W-1]|uniref:bifunctional protein-serine/threonine kinase/phosphatase n=1 Tax=Simiduia sp. 21SJ11W-1 TaxID=2909669 RepID=UPI00209F0042|nr:bifunctional protein-serine/threonine kinase/phosphatase [Simiduia sp. 21SJ11W-1]UTA46879.1 bifunctional protein-serine/threonine kinase/phosphatase [Simiduia sp. 21SJ11W-1]
MTEQDHPSELAITGQKTLKLRFGGSTSAGAKPENQDAFAAHLPKGSVAQLKGGVACIADGVSCSDNAQQASSTSVTLFIEDYFSTPDTWPVKVAANRVLSSLNSWLYHHGQQASARHNGLVTTFSALLIKSNTAHIFHAGDSRIAVLREGGIQPLTRDHCHRQQGNKQFLTRALGMDSRLEVDYVQEETAVGDIFVLTTDGVHDWLGDADISALILAAGDDLEQAAHALCEQARARGSDDNLTCLLVKVEELPLAELDEVHKKLTQLVIPPVLQEGQKLDHYEVLSVMHSGTRSHVYKVQDINTQRYYALKAPSENFKDDAQYLEGFIREQWVGRRINHPGVMKILPRPEKSPFLYHVCEWVEGITLRQWIFDNPAPSFNQVREWMEKLVASLRAFQRLSMIHRDLKPENIIITPKGRPVIIDFGTVYVAGLGEIASPLIEDVPVGSVDYIAPEYLLGQPGSDRSDLFSLAVIAYEMLCGQLPFKLPNMQHNPPKHFDQWRYQPLRQVRKDVPLWLDLALEKALSPNPRGRYAAYSEFLHDLTQPNRALVASFEAEPLLERNPVLFWRSLALVLALALIIQSVYFAT